MSDNKCKNCYYYLSSTTDVQTRFSQPGWRFIYNLIAWIILGIITDGGSGIFISLMFFSAPLLMDYIKFRPLEKWRLYIFIFPSIVLLSLWGFIGFIGLIGIFESVVANNNLYIQVTEKFIVFGGSRFTFNIIWYTIGFNVLSTLADFFVAPRRIEEEYDWKKIKKELETM